MIKTTDYSHHNTIINTGQGPTWYYDHDAKQNSFTTSGTRSTKDYEEFMAYVNSQKKVIQIGDITLTEVDLADLLSIAEFIKSDPMLGESYALWRAEQELAK